VLFVDWTLLRLFPPLRAVWAPEGEHTVPITGANARRVLFGTINLRTGHRIVLIRPCASGADARAFLAKLRTHYRAYGTIWLLLDRASAHTDHNTRALAGALDIELLWLPKQAPELNAMDQLWRELKRLPPTAKPSRSTPWPAMPRLGYSTSRHSKRAVKRVCVPNISGLKICCRTFGDLLSSTLSDQNTCIRSCG
jgi:hypothetical protein